MTKICNPVSPYDLQIEFRFKTLPHWLHFSDLEDISTCYMLYVLHIQVTSVACHGIMSKSAELRKMSTLERQVAPISASVFIAQKILNKWSSSLFRHMNQPFRVFFVCFSSYLKHKNNHKQMGDIKLVMSIWNNDLRYQGAINVLVKNENYSAFDT